MLIKEGASDGQVAARFGLNRESVRRHRVNHLKYSPQAAQDQGNALVVVRYATELYERASKVLGAAEELLGRPDVQPTRAIQAAAASLREVRSSIELLARLINTQPETSSPEANSELDALILAQVVRIQTPLQLPPGSEIEDAQVVS